MKLQKLIHIFFMSAIAIAMSACVPKVTEKKAVCGTNQAFNSVTRSCYSIVAPNQPPVADNITPLSFNEDSSSLITLSYSDVDIDKATVCQVTLPAHVTVTTACSCDGLGVCTVGVSGVADYNGPAQFSYTVKANNMVSNTATATFSILPVNDGPAISAIAAQSTNEDTTKNVNFTISDIDSTLVCATAVTVTANSNVGLTPNPVITGTAPNCTATIVPVLNQSGVSTYTLQVSDGALTATSSFTLTVNAVNDVPTITSPISNTSALEDNAATANFTIGDVETVMDCTATYLSASSSNTLLIPSINVTFSGTYPNCVATMTPLADQNGTSNITISVNDGTASTTALAFITTITAVNDAPIISVIADDTTLEDVSKAIAFTINDIDNTLVCSSANVTVTGNTNPTLASSVVVSGTAPNCIVTIIPAVDQSGLSDITLTLSDGALSVTEAFQLTVTAVNDVPYFNSTITTSDTNEGGVVVAGPFKIDEDQGSTTDEDVQSIQISSIVSDNQSVLTDATNPNATSTIRIFYDLNDDGVENSGEERALSADLEGPLPGDPSKDVHGHSFYLKLYPVSGVAGNANVTVTAKEYTGAVNTNTVTTNFSLIVHPVAALHGGWANISAVGIKSDKTGAPVTVVMKPDANGVPVLAGDIKCNYNTISDVYGCDGNKTCTAASGPHGVVTPDAADVLFWDSSNKKCYRSSSTSKFSWLELTTTCPITRVAVSATTLTSAVAIGATTLTVASTSSWPAAGSLKIGSETLAYTAKTSTTFTVAATTAAHAAASAITYPANGTNFITHTASPVATAKNQYYYDADDGLCHISEETSPGIWGWNTAENYIPSKITLSWNAFTVSGSGPDIGVQVYGWNVYRREAGEDYDFQTGYLREASTATMSVTDATTRTFTDTTAVAGKVYYYMVRPVDSIERLINGVPTHLTISTPDIFSEVRVFAPTENFAFVHRWMMNQEVCNSMHMTTTSTKKVDPTHNYRCPYKGPGEGTLTNAGYYDIGKDMLVDISESGCPYTKAPACTANGCIGIGNPNAIDLDLSANTSDVYYDRSSGSCYINTTGANVWVDYNTAAAGQIALASLKVNTALNPPIVNISKAQASLVCTNREVGAVISAALQGTTPVATTAKLSLPSKKEYIAYSASPTGMTDSVVTDMEQGFSLNVQSRCNSSNANGLETAYSDSSIPSTSFIYSLPGTASSGIRSLYTGSVPWVSNFSTETCSSRYGIQDVYGNVAEWVQDTMTCNGAVGYAASTTINGSFGIGATSITVAATTGFPSTGNLTVGLETVSYSAKTATTFTISATTATHATGDAVTLVPAAANYVCSVNSGTDFGNYDFLNGVYNAGATDRYKFNLSTGPYNDIDATSTPSSGDGFLDTWDFRDELYGAGKFSFPMGMPIYVDIATPFPTAPSLPYFLDIGPTAGITTSQLHEDGIMVRGMAVNNTLAANDAGNPNGFTPNPTQTGSFAQGGSYLSGNFSGRYSSEVVPDADVRPDVGFRCYLPIIPANFPADAARHPYSY